MSTIIDQLTEKPVTCYYTITTFCISFYMVFVKMDPYNYLFIPSKFLAGQWWRIFTAPMVFVDGLLLITSCLILIYFGMRLENRISSEKFLKALVLGYGMIIISLIIISFLPHLPMAFYPIYNPGAIIVFLLQLFAHIIPNVQLKLIGCCINFPVVISPFILAVLYYNTFYYASSLLLALLYGYLFPDIFPDIIRRAPNENMSYNPAGFWVKKPSNKPKGKFSGKPHKLND